MRRIAFITDTHLDEDYPAQHGVDARKNLQAILQDLAAKNIREIIFGGDIGAPSSNQWFFDRLKAFELKVVLGNHDQFSEASKHFHAVKSAGKDALYYTVEDKHFKQIFLDTSTERISEAQLNWFKQEIQTGKKLLIFIHHPVLETGTVVDKLYPLHGKQQLRYELLSIQNEATIFCGHCHTVDEQKQQNITQLMTLASSFQIDKNAADIKVDTGTYGYRILTLSGDNIQTEIITF